MVVLNFLVLFLFAFPALSARPPKASCIPYRRLIHYIKDEPDGRRFCSKLINSGDNIATVTVTETTTNSVVETASVTETAIATGTVMFTASSLSTFFGTVTSTAFMTTQTAVVTAAYGTTGATTKTEVLTDVQLVTVTLTTTSTFTPTPNRPSVDRRQPHPATTFYSPGSFPVQVGSYVTNSRRSRFRIPPSFYGVSPSALSSACKCVIGYPTPKYAAATVTVTTTSTVLTTGTITATFFTTVPLTKTLTTSTVDVTSATKTTNLFLTATTSTTTTATETLAHTKTATIFTTTLSTVVVTATATATATAYPDCNRGYGMTRRLGTVNKVLVAEVDDEEDGDMQCCIRCHNTPDCFASLFGGWMCQMAVNDVTVSSGQGLANPSCPLGIKNFPFTGQGKVFPGPCGR